MTFDQSEYDLRCEWGPRGIEALISSADVAVIVDVLSFSTCVEIAASRGAIVFPCRWKDESASAFAGEMDAELAGPRGANGFSLSPQSLFRATPGARIVLPSPNGSTLTLSTGQIPTIAGCLRNAEAVARAASRLGRRIAVIPAGEQWPGGSLRPCLEDWLGAGAIIRHLPGSKSPEALAAEDLFRASAKNIEARLLACGTGKELIERGYPDDVLIASELNVSECVPMLAGGAYRAATRDDLVHACRTEGRS